MSEVIMDIFKAILIIIIIIFILLLIIIGNINKSKNNLQNNEYYYQQNYYDFYNKRITKDEHNKKVIKNNNFTKGRISTKNGIYHTKNNFIKDYNIYYDRNNNYKYIDEDNYIFDNILNNQDNIYREFIDDKAYNKTNYLKDTRNYYKNILSNKNANKNSNEIFNLSTVPEKNLFKEIKYDKKDYYEKKNLEDKEIYGYMYELPKINERIILVDTEVTGKYYYDRIIEICAREMINGLMTKNIFHSFFKPKSFMSDKNIKFHKIPKEAFYYSQDEERKIWIEFLEFINNSLIITHNARYDMEKINKELEFNNLPLINYKQFRCSMRIFLDKNPLFSQKFSKLKECCQKYKIGYNKRTLHTATYDTFLWEN